jgi:hypothetical protein
VAVHPKASSPLAPFLLLALACALSLAPAPSLAQSDAAPPAAASPVPATTPAPAPPAVAPPAAGPAPAAPPAGVGAIGIIVPDGGSIPDGFASPLPSAACVVMLRVGHETLDAPERLDPLLDAARNAGLRVAILLEAGGLDLPAGVAADTAPAQGPVNDWSTRLDDLVRHAGARVAAYSIFGRAADRFDPRAYAFLLKRAAVTIRAAQPKARIIGPTLAVEDLPWADAVSARDAAPYVDVVAAEGAGALPAVADLRDRLDPASPLWVVDATVDPAAVRPSIVDAYVRSLSGGAEAVLFSPDATVPIGSFASQLRALLTPSLAPATAAVLPFDPAGARLTGDPSIPAAVAETARRPAGLETFVFHDQRTRQGIVAYRSPAAGDSDWLRLVIRSPVDSLSLINPATMAEMPVASSLPAGRVVFVSVKPTLMLLRFRLAAGGVPLQESSVGAVADLSAEEIIALERQFSEAQRRRLRHYEARASVAIHYRIAAVAQTVDLLTENRLYVHDGQQDYEQTDLFVEGARWRGKTPPYLPFIQPDKVKQVPLDIALDEDYRYRLLGRNRVEGRDCYELEFEPTVTDRSLYKGKVFIDATLFTRVRMEAMQTGLSDPLRSNQVNYRFGPVPAPGGDFWLPLEVTGQMAFEVLGQNLVVEREAHFSEFSINGDDFQARLEAAFGSGRPMFRENDEGFYRLDTKGGQQKLTSASTPRNAFLVFGINIGSTGLPSLPFAGINWFDIDFKGSGTQLNVAWAGPFVDVSWTNPHLTEPRGDSVPLAFTAGANVNAWPKHDKYAREAGTSAAEEINIYEQALRGTLAVPMGRQWRWSFEPRVTYMNFDRRDETPVEFVLPPTTVDYGLLARLEWARSGYILSGWDEWGRRTQWDAWGLPGTPFDPDDRDYTRYGGSAAKTFYLGAFTKLSGGVAGFSGRSLDRFSQYELGDFRSARVRGFNSSGVHFDRGLIADAALGFTVHQTVRVDVGVQSGWVQNEEAFGDGTERLVGAGLALEFSGPWSTLVSLRVAHALSSTIEDKGGGGDLRIIFFRTFDRWSRPPRANWPAPPPDAYGPPDFP